VGGANQNVRKGTSGLFLGKKKIRPVGSGSGLSTGKLVANQFEFSRGENVWGGKKNNIGNLLKRV